MLASGTHTRGAATLDDWNTVRSDDLDVGHRGRFFHEHTDFHAATGRKCPKFTKSWSLETHLLDQARIQRLRADTESGIVTLAPTLPKHPIMQFRLTILRIGLLQYLPQSFPLTGISTSVVPASFLLSEHNLVCP
jgi:hypothetical protein